MARELIFNFLPIIFFFHVRQRFVYNAIQSFDRVENIQKEAFIKKEPRRWVKICSTCSENISESTKIGKISQAAREVNLVDKQIQELSEFITKIKEHFFKIKIFLLTINFHDIK